MYNSRCESRKELGVYRDIGKEMLISYLCDMLPGVFERMMHMNIALVVLPICVLTLLILPMRGMLPLYD